MAGQTTHYHLSKPTGAEAPDVSLLNGNMDTIDDELYTRAKSWNGIAADENGDIAATTIQLAENLSSSSNNTVEGEFIMRTSGGSSSVRDSVRSATLESVHGGRIHTGQTQTSAGTITQSTPMTFVSTGWNLYNHNSACAIVTRYSETYGFMVSGSYTALRYSATVNGARSEITPDSAGRFNVPGDGYVWVTGGNNTDTAIWATWSDWTVRYEGDFQPYTESVVDISEPINTYFPYGLMRVGNYWDEINLSTGQAYSVIERMDNTPTNMQTAEASGRAYEYDENYIYIVRQSTVTYIIPNIDNAFTPNDHGMEYFTNTEAPATARCIYGVNLKNKLERDVLTISKQQLTAAQQAQVRENIGVAGSGPLDGALLLRSYSYVIPSVTSSAELTAEMFGITQIDGYTPVAVTAFSSGSSQLCAYLVNTRALDGTVMMVKNLGSETATNKLAFLNILWAKNSLVS